jgi:threonylcarbamoyladenosine tRNA methylthiotransferase MtaB
MMERPYTSRQYAKAVEKAHAKLPGVALGCDILAGFPGETKDDFKMSARMLEDLPFSYAHVFQYSPRPFTAAYEMEDSVADGEKKERVEELKEIAGRKNLSFKKALVGKKAQVLVEKLKTESSCRGKTDTFVQVEFKRVNARQGDLAWVNIVGVTQTGLRGEESTPQKAEA